MPSQVEFVNIVQTNKAQETTAVSQEGLRVLVKRVKLHVATIVVRW